jgi:hypothetical protein
MITLYKKIKNIINGTYRITGQPVEVYVGRDCLQVFIGDIFGAEDVIAYLTVLSEKTKKTLHIKYYTNYADAETTLQNDFIEGNPSYDIYILASRLFENERPGEKRKQRLTDDLWAGIPRNKLIVTSEDETFRALAQENGVYATKKMHPTNDNSMLIEKIQTLLPLKK